MNLQDYDLVIVNTSGGKDSQTILRMVCGLAKTQGVLARVVAVHAVLEEEWQGTKELVQTQCDFYGVPVDYVKRPQGSLLAQIERRGMWPSSGQRYCTSDHKRGQIAKVVNARSNALNKPHVRVLNVMGIRAAESPNRAKMQVITTNKRASNGKRTVVDWLPIFGWSEADVWADIRSSGVPYHHAYDLGMPRLSCCFCVFASKNALLLAGKHNPEMLGRYVQVEKRIKHTFRKELPIAQIQEDLANGIEPGAITTWEM